MSIYKELENMDDERAAKERALQILSASKYVKDTLVDMEKQAKQFLTTGAMKSGDRSKAQFVDSEGVEFDTATVSMSETGQKWVIADEEAFGRWLEASGRETNPWQMRLSPRVSGSAYLRLLRSALGDTGEIPEGVDVADVAPSLRVSQSVKQREAIRAVANAFGLELALRAITGGQEADDE